MKKMTTKYISLVLSILMIFYVFPYGVMGEEKAESGNTESDNITEVTQAQGSEMSEETVEEPAYVLHEAENLREEKAKHYRMSNGSFAAIEFPHAVHYKNENDEFAEIDNTLSLGENGYSTNGNPVKYSFNNDLYSNELLSCEYGDYSLSLSFEEDTAEMQEQELNINGENAASESARSIEITNPGTQMIEVSENSASVYSNRESSAVNEKPSIEDIIKTQIKNESSIKYVNVSEGIDLRYDILGNNIKEYIILSEVPEANVFSFGMSLENLVPLLNEDKSISLYDRNQEEIFKIPAPYMVDAEGNISYDCEYILTQEEEGFKLKVSVSSDWLNAEERVYPVMIDPAINVDDTNGTDAITTEYYTSYGQSVQSDTRMVMVGYSVGSGVYTTHLKVNTLPELPYGTIPTKAYIAMAQYSFTNNALSELIVSARTVTGSTWYQSDNYASIALDYTKLSSATTSSFVSWDISDAAKGWYEYNTDSTSSKAIANNGIVLISETGNSDESYARATMYGFLSSNFGINAEPKMIYITAI